MTTGRTRLAAVRTDLKRRIYFQELFLTLRSATIVRHGVEFTTCFMSATSDIADKDQTSLSDHNLSTMASFYRWVFDMVVVSGKLSVYQATATAEITYA
ncbi:hypothetical protein ARMSODRAFT_105365 [Armillaria solidipes]|uniref:Uncharacterized protein n=1 Tax=Armillaria solidipes TaxID=1076256 RepID=A0A2H3AIC3_9AGAR|nr:hypothetical protein ARMSODRAFT_105365 [Armillaria solidipes]